MPEIILNKQTEKELKDVLDEIAEQEEMWRDGVEAIERYWDTDYGRFELSEDKKKLVLITGGWSENERVINVISRSTMFYLLFWQASFRGGKYVFGLES